MILKPAVCLYPRKEYSRHGIYYIERKECFVLPLVGFVASGPKISRWTRHVVYSRSRSPFGPTPSVHCNFPFLPIKGLRVPRLDNKARTSRANRNCSFFDVQFLYASCNSIYYTCLRLTCSLRDSRLPRRVLSQRDKVGF